MKKSSSILWLFLIPLLVPLFVIGVQRWQNTQLTNYFVGGYTDETTGERAAMKKLAQVVAEGRDRGKIRVRWDVFKPASKPTTKRPTELWIYGVIYDRQSKCLLRYMVSPRFTDMNEVEAIQYDNVTDTTIQALGQSRDTYSDLVKYGAVFIKQGKADFVDGYGPVFR